MEDLGVRPDEPHFMTRDDLLHGNRDLIEHAARLLTGMPARRLDVTVEREGMIATIKPETIVGLTRLDIYADGRPLASFEWGDEPPIMDVGVPSGGQVLELVGHNLENGKWVRVAARKYPLEETQTNNPAFG